VRSGSPKTASVLLATAMPARVLQGEASAVLLRSVQQRGPGREVAQGAPGNRTGPAPRAVRKDSAGEILREGSDRAEKSEAQTWCADLAAGGRCSCGQITVHCPSGVNEVSGDGRPVSAESPGARRRKCLGSACGECPSPLRGTRGLPRTHRDGVTVKPMSATTRRYEVRQLI
jgi:hypothetical protein